MLLLLVSIIVSPPSSLIWASAGLGETTATARVRVGVFGLFHPRELVLMPVGSTALIVQAGNEQVILEQSSGYNSVRISISAAGIVLSTGGRSVVTRSLHVTGRSDGRVSFELSVPHRIRRTYVGTLDVVIANGILIPVVGFEREDVVSAVVAAESAPDSPPEALKAQAIAARSYLAAAPSRHVGFDFCDTTHCQFLRDIPADNTPAAKATTATRNLVLTYQSHSFAAMYTRSCSGRTHTPAEVRLSVAAYPYYPVQCAYCRTHVVHWSAHFAAADAASLHSNDEALRLAFVRRFGTAAAPSNDFAITEHGGEVFLHGVGQGHGIGMCQTGAKAMAKAGADYRQILAHYYPNTTVGNASSAEGNRR
jgi:peptidoglycan hydrolase-like amidase